jgi:hypothetical protein
VGVLASHYGDGRLGDLREGELCQVDSALEHNAEAGLDPLGPRDGVAGFYGLGMRH